MAVEKATVVQNWTQFLVAAYLAKNFELCLEVWDSIMTMLGDDPLKQMKLNELNELFLFRTEIFIEMKEFKKGIKFIAKH